MSKKKEKGISFKFSDEVFNNLEKLSKLTGETKTKIIEDSINELNEFYSKVEFIEKEIEEKGYCYLITPETHVRGFIFNNNTNQLSNSMDDIVEIRVDMKIKKFNPALDVLWQHYYSSDFKYTLEKDYTIIGKNANMFYLPGFKFFGKSIVQLLKQDRSFNIANINVFFSNQ